MPYFGVGLHVFVAIFFAIHAIRHKRELYWLMILFAFPLFGSIVYFFAVYLPDSRLHHGVRKVGVAALNSLDPGKELREAHAAFDLTPSAQNQMRLAAAFLEAGDAKQAAEHYDACLKGPFSKQAEILFGAVKARLQNGQAVAALDLLTQIRATHPEFRKEAIALLFAQAYGMDEKNAQAREEYAYAAKHYGSVEAVAEYAIWAISSGDIATAKAQQAELENMKKHWSSHHYAMHKSLLKRVDAAFSEARV